MARFNTVSFTYDEDTFYFTHNALVGGKPCKLAVQGLDGLFLTKTGKTDVNAEGAAFNFIVEAGSVPITITVNYMTEESFEDLKELLQTILDDEETLSVSISGDLGNFTVECLPRLPKPLEASGEFSNGIVDGITINLAKA